MIKLAVIADDLTGANDTAVQFAKHNISSVVSIDFAKQNVLENNADVVVIDTDSRDVTAKEAYQKVKDICEILKENDILHIYKKVDSTLRGNLGAEIEAAATVMDSKVVVIVPAFPRNQRMTVGGYHLLNGIPLELTEIAHSPKSPVDESRIVELLQRQTSCQIGLISFQDVIKGVACIRERIAECLQQGEKWIVFDTVKEEHLKMIVEAVKDHENILWVGSAGLADYLPDLYPWSFCEHKSITCEDAPVLIVAGSISEITQKQIAKVLDEPNMQLVKVDVAQLIQDKTAEMQRCVAQLRTCFEQGQNVLLASAVNKKDVELSMATGWQYKMSEPEVSEQTATAMGSIVKELVDIKLSGMVLTGGDTAIHVCRALAAEAIEIVEEVAVGIPLGRLVGGSCDGLQVVTKAGAFGEADSFVKAIAAIQKAVVKKR